MTDRLDGWIERVLKRADDLRSRGVLSIGVDGCTATFAEKDLTPAAVDDDKDDEPAWTEPMNPWEDPASYPSGFVPQMTVDDLSKEKKR